MTFNNSTPLSGVAASPFADVRRITGPEELVQAVPYLLGFHPSDSLVLVGLNAGELVVTARMDLAGGKEPECVRDSLVRLAGNGVTSLVALVYDDPPPAGTGERIGLTASERWGWLVGTVDAAAEGAGCDLLDVLLVSAGRWLSLVCDAPECCPPGGKPLEEASSLFAAAATYDGIVALPDRRALESLLDPVSDSRPGPDLQEADVEWRRAQASGESQRHERSVKRALFRAARASMLPGWVPPDDSTVVRYAVSLRSSSLRDALWLAVDDRRISGRPLWQEIARRVPSPYNAAPLFLFGWACWREGYGTLADIAARRAVASVPDYCAAELLLAAISTGTDPRRFPRLSASRSTRGVGANGVRGAPRE